MIKVGDIFDHLGYEELEPEYYVVQELTVDKHGTEFAGVEVYTNRKIRFDDCDDNYEYKNGRHIYWYACGWLESDDWRRVSPLEFLAWSGT